MNTTYGPSSSRTSVSGMAAASSITSKSAAPSLWASWGWRYCGSWAKAEEERRDITGEQALTLRGGGCNQKKKCWAKTHLNGLSVAVLEDVDAHNGLVELRVGRLDQLVVCVLLCGLQNGEKECRCQSHRRQLTGCYLCGLDGPEAHLQANSIKAFEDKLKQSLEVLRARRSHVDARVAAAGTETEREGREKVHFHGETNVGHHIPTLCRANPSG